MAVFYGTFPRLSQLHRHYVKIEADDIWSARELMSLMYGAAWSEVYGEERSADVAAAGLTEVKFGTLQEEVS